MGDTFDSKSAGERLRKARERCDFDTAAEAARAHGWHEVTYRAHEDGTSRPVTRKAAEKYALAFRVSPEWILFGRNPPKWDVEATPLRMPLNYRMVPKLSFEDALGVPRVLRERRDYNHAVIDSAQSLGSSIFVVEIEDDSMRANPPIGNDSFLSGDMVVIDPDQFPRPGDFVLAHIPGMQRAIFRKYRSKGASNAFELVPLNSDYASETSSDDRRIRIIGRMVRHSRNY